MQAAPAPPHAAIALWPLPLLAGLLPALAALLAWGLATHLNLVPSCNPFFEGCVSISRAARHGLPNHVFRALVLPAAALQGLCWLITARWLLQRCASTGLRPGLGLRLLAALGLAAGVALVLYGAFLGTEGSVYRLLRQYGTVVYFGFTCLCLLIAGAAVQTLARGGVFQIGRVTLHAMSALSIALVLLGLVSVGVGAVGGDDLKYRVENITEWWAGLIFVLGFVALSTLWRRCGLRAWLGQD